MIIVGPYEALVDIQGNVKRPMIYEMRPTESVAQAIKYAGGYTSEAYQKAIRLTRKSGDRFSVHTVGEFDMSAFKVTDGDEIQVESMIERYENMVDACTILRSQGLEVHMVEGNRGNIKVTTPEDVYMFRALLQYRENEQAFGYGLTDKINARRH